MTPIVELLICVVAMASVSLGCSPPDGGYKKPTEVEKVHFSGHVLIGNVLRRIDPDPYYQDTNKNETYGAEVRVQCTYKGPILGDTITIHGAGNVPGHCTSKNLDKGENYIIFLRAKDATEETYEQTYPAEIYYDSFVGGPMEKYLNICGLEMRYPQENGMPLRREVCPETTKQTTCQRYIEGAQKEPKKAPVPSVEVRIRDGNATMTTQDPNDSSSGVVASVVLLAICALVGRVM